jgi:hypothetical protein
MEWMGVEIRFDTDQSRAWLKRRGEKMWEEDKEEGVMERDRDDFYLYQTLTALAHACSLFQWRLRAWAMFLNACLGWPCLGFISRGDSDLSWQ